MQLDGKTLRLAATDLAKQIACKHLIELERGVAEGTLERPFRSDPTFELLLERGLAHETAYIESLRREGRAVVELSDSGGDTRVERTAAAMRDGADVIVQGALRHGRWQGRADVLLRVDGSSDLGPWSYEVADTKLSQQTRAGTVLQLCLYSDLVGRVQGRAPKSMGVVKPGSPPVEERFRFDDYAAYYRLVRRRLEQTADAGARGKTYPDPVPHCEICAWWARCDQRRRKDDHLSLVAGMQALHRAELQRQGIGTLEGFADLEAPLPGPPERGNLDAFARLQQQARIQLRGRREGARVYELLDVESDRGLCLLPRPSPNDVYFDLESDPFVDDGGLEYLFGWCDRERGGVGVAGLTYRSIRALDRAAERRALETFVDLVMQRWREDPDMHVYHYAPYEPAAIKRMIGRHATRESDVDRLLRGKRFVDLHAVARQGLRASVESYSLKELEPFAGFRRDVSLPDARLALRGVAWALELGRPVPAEDLDTVEGYNRDDCLATAALHDWLEQLRGEHEQAGTQVPRPEHDEGRASEALEQRQAEVREVYEQLTAGLPEDRAAWNDEQRACWLLANLLEYYRREQKCAWWEFFRLHELDPEELLAERKTVTDLRFVERMAGNSPGCPIDRYAFPPQEAALREDDELHEVGGNEVGTLVAIDQARRTLDIRKRKAAKDVNPGSILVNQNVRPRPLDTSLLTLARSVAEHGVDGAGPYRAARDLLLKRPPRRQDGSTPGLRRNDEKALDAAVRLAGELDHGTLAIQGPPGSGKTYTGARMIVELGRRGKRVGVTAVSHKVVRNLLDKALEAAREAGVSLGAVHKVKKPLGDAPDELEETTDNNTALRSLGEGKLVGGTSWLWSRNDAEGALDYLFIDEAGQFSLAQFLSCGRVAENLVLLGDPQQLEQPQQGTHPEGAGISGLDHLLDGRKTIPTDTGLFLDRTWRLHPEICAFTSEIYYEARLKSREGLDRQALDGAPPFDGSGLFHVAVPHTGNQNTSPEEVDAVARIVELLRATGAGWTDGDGVRRPVGVHDVLVVAPYNAHVGALTRRLPDVRVGTVDKFQGQQAPVVVYSMASSSVEDAPRGMEFLFNPNRLNVATSRARCACILVAAPALLEPECHSPLQMRWANGLCRFLELARTVEV